MSCKSAAGSADACRSPTDWEVFEPAVEQFLQEAASTSLKRGLETHSNEGYHLSCIQVLGIQNRELAWRSAALTAEFERARHDSEELPWEVEGSTFRTTDRWYDTVLASLDKVFTPACFDVSDVWQSEVVKSRPLSSQYAAEMLVIPFELKRARRDIVLQDPLATQLGASRRGRLDQGSLHYDTDQSFRDCFRMKA